MAPVATRTRMRRRDLLASALYGLRRLRLRVVMSLVGIAVPVAGLLALAGLAQAADAALLDRLAQLSNLVVAAQAPSVPATSTTSAGAHLPVDAGRMTSRAAFVQSAAGLAAVKVPVYRNEMVPRGQTLGIAVAAVDRQLADVLQARMASGRFLLGGDAALPEVVLGGSAATRLGVSGPGVRVEVGGYRLAVVGILQPLEMAPELDSTALIDFAFARRAFGSDGAPDAVYVRLDPDNEAAGVRLLPLAANPPAPETVQVNHSIAAQQARTATRTTLSVQLIVLTAIALAVAGIGVCNMMLVAVAERRYEIGLRRALGARRVHIAVQFLGEAIAVTMLGGALGTSVGVVVTAVGAHLNSWPMVVPLSAAGLGLLTACVVGVGAGLYPAIAAALTPPAQALRREE